MSMTGLLSPEILRLAQDDRYDFLDNLIKGDMLLTQSPLLRLLLSSPYTRTCCTMPAFRAVSVVLHIVDRALYTA